MTRGPQPMDEKGKEDSLLESAVFDGVPREKLAELSQAVEHIVVPPHTVVIRQGEPGDSFYLINAGKVKIIRVDEEGLETDFATMGRGESFGEMALLTGQPRSATVETLEETRLTVIPKGKFDQILKDYPQVSMKFINQLSSWLLRDDERLQEEKQLAAGRPGISWVDFVIILAISLTFAIFFNNSNPNRIKLFPVDLFAQDLRELQPTAEMGDEKAGEYVLVDARPPKLWDELHIKNSLNIPYAHFDLMYMLSSPQISGAEKIVVSGRTVSRRYDVRVARKLIETGHENVYLLKGGLRAWRKEGLPTGP